MEYLSVLCYFLFIRLFLNFHPFFHPQKHNVTFRQTPFVTPYCWKRDHLVDLLPFLAIFSLVGSWLVRNWDPLRLTFGVINDSGYSEVESQPLVFAVEPATAAVVASSGPSWGEKSKELQLLVVGASVLMARRVWVTVNPEEVDLVNAPTEAALLFHNWTSLMDQMTSAKSNWWFSIERPFELAFASG